MPQNKPITGGYPVRTRQEILTSGDSLASEPSCAPPASESGNKAVLGCMAWPICRFANPAYGTFKGDGPQLIAYFERTIEGNEKTDQIICHGFINSLQAAQDQAIASALKGERHEIIKIIAHEGEEYRTLTRKLTVDPKTKARDWGPPELVTRTVGPVVDPCCSQALKEYRGELSAEYLTGMAHQFVEERE